MTDSVAIPQNDTCGEHSLDHVLSRVSKLLEELRSACLEVQDAANVEGAELSSRAVMKAQALDRITQSLECLAKFNFELAKLNTIDEVFVGQEQFSAINLPSVRAVLEDRIETSEDAGEIALF